MKQDIRVMRGLVCFLSVPRKRMGQQATHLYGNSFTNLSQAEDETLGDTIIDILF